MSNDKIVHIEAGTYSSTYTLGPDNIVHMRHAIHKQRDEVEIDVFGRYWNLNITTLPKGQVYVNRSGEKVAVEGPFAIFLPAYSFIEWHLAPGTVRFDAFLSNAVLPAHFPAEPLLFPYPAQRLPNSLAELRAIVEGRRDVTPLSRGWRASPEALRIKDRIDASFMLQKSFDDMAKELTMPRAVMTRTFKSNFGVPPIAYRNRLRIADSIWLLLTEQFSVADVGYTIGFEDLSRFNKQFKRQIKVPPSRFRFSKSHEPLPRP